MTKINSSQSVDASSSSSSFQSLVEVSGDQTLNQDNSTKQSGFKRKLQVVGQRLRGGLALLVSGLNRNKNNRVPTPNEVNSAGKAGGLPVDLGQLVQLSELHKEAEEALGSSSNDLVQLRNFKSIVDREIEYLQLNVINLGSNGDGDKYLIGEMGRVGDSLKDLSRKYEAYLVPEKDLIQHTLDRTRVDNVYFMRVLSTRDSQLNEIFTITADNSATDESTEFLREFGRAISVGVTTEPQKHETLDGYLKDLKAAMLEDFRSGKDSNLKSLEALGDKFVKYEDQGQSWLVVPGSENKYCLNVSDKEREGVLNNLEKLRNLYQEKTQNNQISVSIEDDKAGLSDGSIVETGEPSTSIEDAAVGVIDDLLLGYKEVVKNIYSTFFKNESVAQALEDVLEEKGLAASN
ncbi:hypothetical protein [Microbulbifer sp. JTAC008]|uniref:hypothetical protein n=1 Tax=unclassified Microbulbifer TaxID=2619833 RepID=UPI004039AAEB